MTAVTDRPLRPAVVRSLRNYSRAQARCQLILTRIRKILLTDSVLGDATFSDEWQPLGAMCVLDDRDWRSAARLRDAFVAAILPDLRDEKQVRVQYARILSLLNDFIFIWEHLDDSDSWPTVRQIGEDY